MKEMDKRPEVVDCNSKDRVKIYFKNLYHVKANQRENSEVYVFHSFR